MKFNLDRIHVGLILGLLVPAFLMLVYWKVNYSYMDMHKFIQFTSIGKIHVKLISLFTAVNLGVFFLFIWRNLNLAARGVLLATFLYALLVVIIKYAS